MTVLARTRRGRTLRALALSIGLVALGACGGGVQESDDGARLVTGRLGSMNDALKTFTVTGLDDQGCVTATYESPTSTTTGVLVVPEGATVSGGAEDLVVRLDDETELRAGDSVEGGGTSLRATNRATMDATNASVLDRVEQTCGADVAVVVNSW